MVKARSKSVHHGEKCRGWKTDRGLYAKDYSNNPGTGSVDVFSSAAQSPAPGRGLFRVIVLFSPKFSNKIHPIKSKMTGTLQLIKDVCANMHV